MHIYAIYTVFQFSLQGHGQASFNDNDGTSLVGRLCDRNLWSYQQDQYDEMFGAEAAEYLLSTCKAFDMTRFQRGVTPFVFWHVIDFTACAFAKMQTCSDMSCGCA